VRPSARAGIALAALWLGTRLLCAWLADHPGSYGAGGTQVAGDPEIYRSWAAAMIERGVAPYEGVRIEYPPGSLPFVAAPWTWVLTGGAYRTGFIAVMVAVDAAGLAGLARLARRGGSWMGPWAWTALLPLLGPIAYVRLDLVPAVATIWAIERAAAQACGAAGAWLGFGVLAKLYPGLLLPAAWLGARRRGRLLLGAAAAVLVVLVPLAASFPALLHSVLGYHSGRGIQVESTWGLGLLVAGRLGAPAAVAYNFGAFHVDAPPAPALETLSLVLSLALLAAGTWRIGRRVAGGDVAGLALGLLGLLAGVLVTGTVLSPQFVVWIVALGAAAACWTGTGWALPVLLLAPAAALTQALYPFAYNRLLLADPGALALLGLRNGLLAATALVAFGALSRPAPR
jgi:hypothetical protein